MYSYDVNASINCKVLQLFQCFVARVVFQSAAMEVKQCATQKSFIYLCPVDGERARAVTNARNTAFPLQRPGKLSARTESR